MEAIINPWTIIGWAVLVLMALFILLFVLGLFFPRDWK